MRDTHLTRMQFQHHGRWLVFEILENLPYIKVDKTWGTHLSLMQFKHHGLATVCTIKHHQKAISFMCAELQTHINIIRQTFICGIHNTISYLH